MHGCGWGDNLKQEWLKDPLVHFLIVGALLFGAYSWLNRDQPGERVIQITAQEVDWLKETWVRQWHRPPDESEFRGLLAGYLKESLFAREAEAIGMAKDDVVIRRRLAQKMEFLVQDTARLGEPDEVVLRQLFEQTRAQYLSAPKAAFSQIFFKSEAAARQGLVQLNKAGPDGLGEPSMLPRDIPLADAQAISSQFGPVFAQQLFKLDAGRWQGPIPSTYGMHLVRIESRQEARAESFESARSKVLAAWQTEQQEKAARQYLAELARKYEIVAEESIRPLLAPALAQTQ